jgi:hypothetical protein
VQTFLPYPDFVKSVEALDFQRLGKQRVEAYQILNVLYRGDNTDVAWANHPAVRMWRGHIESLSEYLDCCIVAWIARGGENNMSLTRLSGPKPWWFGSDYFHRSHRSNLLRKDEVYYRQFGWTEPTNLPYVWPV